jgi:hypothetical protein
MTINVGCDVPGSLIEEFAALTKRHVGFDESRGVSNIAHAGSPIEGIRPM